MAGAREYGLLLILRAEQAVSLCHSQGTSTVILAFAHKTSEREG